MVSRGAEPRRRAAAARQPRGSAVGGRGRTPWRSQEKGGRGLGGEGRPLHRRPPPRTRRWWRCRRHADRGAGRTWVAAGGGNRTPRATHRVTTGCRRGVGKRRPAAKKHSSCRTVASSRGGQHSCRRMAAEAADTAVDEEGELRRGSFGGGGKDGSTRRGRGAVQTRPDQGYLAKGTTRESNKGVRSTFDRNEGIRNIHMPFLQAVPRVSVMLLPGHCKGISGISQKNF